MIDSLLGIEVYWNAHRRAVQRDTIREDLTKSGKV